MPITLQTKFDLGAVVFLASTEGVSKRHPCPDCLGVRRWQAISPAGYGYTFECPRCSATHISDRKLDLRFFEYEPRATRLTLVEFRGMDEAHCQWFAAETSSGSPGHRSGNYYSEADLFATEEEALEVARFKCFEQNDRHAANPGVAEGRALRLRVCDYQISEARRIGDAGESATRARWKLTDFLVELEATIESDGFPKADEAIVRALILAHFPEWADQ